MKETNMKKEIVVTGVGAISKAPEISLWNSPWHAVNQVSAEPLHSGHPNPWCLRHHIQQPNLRQRLASAILPARQSVTKRAACQVNLYQLSVYVYLLDNGRWFLVHLVPYPELMFHYSVGIKYFNYINLLYFISFNLFQKYINIHRC